MPADAGDLTYCRAVSGLQILFWTKVYIFSDGFLSDSNLQPNIPSDHTKQFLDITTLPSDGG